MLANWFNNFLVWIRRLFWLEKMELTLIGLQSSGKTTFVNVISNEEFNEDMIPTVGFNLKLVKKGNVDIKMWDIGGQPRFRPMWERYCRGVNAIIFMVDSADPNRFPAAKTELIGLLDKPQLANIPVLVLGNKNDLSGAVGVDELIRELDLTSITDREICCYSISCKNKNNLDVSLQWLVKHSKLPPQVAP
ncbi:hypothetical protein ACOME3_006109 [Neoechinorhynchus agilis]